MKFNSMTGANFMALGPSFTVYLADRGLNLLQGVNNDDTSANSNGAGKSSIADALSWCLFAITARGEKGDAVVNDIAGKGTFVSTHLSDGDSHYIVTRYRKHDTGKNSVVLTVQNNDGTLTDISRGTDAETQVEIERIIGCNYEVFAASIYAGQEHMPNLPGMTDKALKSLIEQAAGVERLERAYTVAKQEGLAAKNKLSLISAGIESAESAVHRAEVAIERAALRAEDHEGKTKLQVQTLTESSARALAEARTMLTDLSKKVSPARTARLAEIASELSSFNAQRDGVTAAQKAAQTFEISAALARSAYEEARAETIAFANRARNAEAELSKPCGECGKPHGADEVDTLRQHLTQKAHAAKKIVDEKLAILNEKSAGHSRACELASELASELPDVSALVAESTALNAEEKGVAEEKDRIAKKVAESKTLSEQANQLSSALNPYRSAIDDARKDLSDATALVASKKAEFDAATHEYKVAQEVARVFGPAGVRAYIIDTVTPFLNDRTALYLGTLSDGNIAATWNTLSRTAKGEVKEKFNIEVANAKGGKSFGLISGGEKRKVRLATMLALQDLVASRATKPISLWLADEVDDALDSAGLERLMTILEMKARERGTVIVVSHNDLSVWADNVTVIEKRNGVSTVSGSLTEMV